MNRFFLVVLVIFLSYSVFAQIPAFPGAEGHGRYTTGGRGGNVVYVTSLDDDIRTPGTFRWALDQASPKIIMFKVSGTIILKSNLTISKGNVTIAGQTAPGDGICIAGFPVSVGADNVIIRYLRFRMGDLYDLNSDGADALGGRKRKNIIVDHCSMSWSTDECVSFYENENFTLQWCIIAESLRLSGHSKGPHGYGGIWGGVNASFHHNLLAHHDSRTPRFGPGRNTQLRELTDYRNNVIYNYGGLGCYGGEAMKINLVNNYYKPGPASPTGIRRGRIYGPDMKLNVSTNDGFYPINNTWGKFYVDGNMFDTSTSSSSDKQVCIDATNDNWNNGIYNQFDGKYTITQAVKNSVKADVPFSASVVTTHTADVAYQKVLALAGCSFKRDSHDERIVDETHKGTAPFVGLSVYNGYNANYPGSTVNWKSSGHPKPGIIDSQQDLKPAGAPNDWSAWPVLKSGTALVDSDNDGMPDEWELANGLDPNNPADGKTTTLHGQFTNVEVYINQLVEHITSQQLADGYLTSAQNKLPKNNSFKVNTQFDGSNLLLTGNNDMKKIELYGVSGNRVKLLEGKFIQANICTMGICRGVYIVKVLGFSGEEFVGKIALNQ